MPVRSQAQWRLMQARAHANPKKERRHEAAPGPSKAVAREFVAASKGMDVSALPERVEKK